MPLHQVISPSSLEHLVRVHTSTLTPSTAAVAGVLAVGLSDRDAANALNLSINTIRNHIVALRERIGGGDGVMTRGFIVAWIWLHMGCCSGGIMRETMSSRQLATRLTDFHGCHHALHDLDVTSVVQLLFGEFTGRQYASQLGIPWSRRSDVQVWTLMHVSCCLPRLTTRELAQGMQQLFRSSRSVHDLIEELA